MSGCIPDLIFDCFILDEEGFGGKLDTDGGFGIDAEGVVDEPGEEVGFADAGVANDDDLEEVVKLLLPCHKLLNDNYNM